MYRRKQVAFSLLVVLSLLLTTFAPALAQDVPATPDGGKQIFLPMISSGTAQQAAHPLTLGSVPTAGSVQSVAKAAHVGAAALPADRFRLVSIIVATDPAADPSQIAAGAGGQVVHRYTKVFSGASMVVPPGNVEQVANAQGVKAVYLDTLQKPTTEVSPTFINAPTIWRQLGGQESAGDNVTVGILDTGIWPEHPSFSDPDPSGKAYGDPAVKPGSNGFAGNTPRSTCDFGNTAYNPDDAPFTCNNKLIGAYSFLDTYKAVVGLLPAEFDSARDSEGHGTHTSSTAAGNAGVAASIYDIPRGIVSGVAPRAHVIMYRVCANDGCFSSDSMAAIEQAILDGVNTINYSIGGAPANPYTDPVEQTFLKAYASGIFVAASAGNSGPAPDTTDHRGPWVTTVGASTTNRSFVGKLTLTAAGGETLELSGATVTPGIPSAPVVVAPDPLCGPMPAGSLTGKVAVCNRGVYGRVEKSYNVAQAGGVGMILRNMVANQDLDTDNYFIPGIHITKESGDALQAFLDSHTDVMASSTAGEATKSQGDVMAAFSSRGGPGQTLGVSKPDITAPGVQILAGNTPDPSSVDTGLPGQLFQAIQGTSMSSPHIAGSAALLKALHPEWSPGQIKSAIMTTAKVAGVYKEDGVTPADPFDFGSGRVNLKYAGDPGLTFDESAENYVALKDQLWNANYPSLYIPVMPGRITVSRTVHNETDDTVEWRLRVTAPDDVTVSVPRTIKVDPHGDATFQITVDARQVPLGEVRFAMLRLQSKDRYGRYAETDDAQAGDAQAGDAEVDAAGADGGDHGGPGPGWQRARTLVFPITLVRNQPAVTLTKSCDPADLGKRGVTTCTITANNMSFSPANVEITDRVPDNLRVLRDSVSGATLQGNTLSFQGALAAAEPPDVTVVETTDSPGGGYLPLSAFGIEPLAGLTDDSIVNLTVPDFVFAGETYSTIGVVSNGFAVVGGGEETDVTPLNQNLPDPTPPNNVLAPFWTDLNPEAGGAVRAGVLTDGVSNWLVIDYDSVPNFGSNQTNSFQIWIGLNGTQDITFAYGKVTHGTQDLLTIGAENKYGNRGQSYVYNATGAVPGENGQLRVLAGALVPGGSQVITFSARAEQWGAWTNCAEMTSDIYQGVNIACFSGTVGR